MSEEKFVSKVIEKNMETVMHESMMPYSEYVILDRALPRVEDGLKPVQRRILYSMNELGVTPDKPYRKCAKIVGDVLGKYHPHGDRSIYDAMVRMAQDFSLRACLVDGHGNFGSVDGDGAAAMRYTEARMTPLALELLRDIDKNTVKWSCNFDDTTVEPDMLPGRFPNLLVNGAMGIAVGLATNIPPHNLGEVIDGVVAYIDNPRVKLEEIMKYIKAPDFPTGGYIINDSELLRAYETGRGKVTIRAKMHIEVGDNDKRLIVIDELPFQVNKATLLENILKLREDKKDILGGISEITDESDRNGMRAVIKVKKDVECKPIVDFLLKKTQLSLSFGINMVAIADGKPQQMGIMDIIAYYVNYQREVILRRTKFDLEAAKKREHILEGLVIAVRNIDEVIKIIKGSESVTQAKTRLKERFTLSEIQAQAILDLRLARLTHLEVFKLEKELEEVRSLILRLEAIVASRKMQMEVIKTEMLQIKRNYKDARRTEILKSLDDYKVPSETDAKPIEDFVISYNALGNIKKMTIKHFNMTTKEFGENSSLAEIGQILIKASSNERLYCFTALGNCYKLDVSAIPDGRWKEKGGIIKNVITDWDNNDRIAQMFVVGDILPKGNLLFYTRDGMVKKSEWSEYGVVKASFQAIKLKDGDVVVGIEQEKKGSSLMFVTNQGMSLNADMSDIPLQGRVTGGVKGIQLSDDDKCLLITQVTGDGEIGVVSDKGYCKRVIVSQLDVMARYRKGVKIIDFNKNDNGANLVFAFYVKDPVTFVLNDGEDNLYAFSSEDIRIENRTHSGRIISKGIKAIKSGLMYLDRYGND